MIKHALSILCLLTATSLAVSETVVPENPSSPSPSWDTQAEAATDSFLIEWKQSQFADRNAQIEFRKNNLDPHLRLKSCSVPLDVGIVTLSKNFKHMTVAIKCESPRWKINRPIVLSIMQDAVVMAHSVPRGTVLTQDHLTLKKIDLTHQHRGFYNSIKPLLGAATRVSLRMGQIIGPNQVKPQYFVHKQQEVVISANTKSLSINVKGVALESGFLGDIISVRNPRSDRVIEGRITGIGKVAVAL